MSRSEWIQQALIAAQNPDGGFGYYQGAPSWTEPTALAILALHGLDRESDEARRGAEWLRRLVRADGGVPPCPAVRQSSWVTALVVLVESVFGRITAGAPLVLWLLHQTGEESRTLVRLRNWMLGNKEVTPLIPGWPWFPGSASWVMPTAWTIIALNHVNVRNRSPELERRCELGRQFLLSRQCQDGGWNHGASRALGYEAPSYPETTGIALLALQGARSHQIERALVTGEDMLSRPTSQSAQWLALGLRAHGRRVLPDPPPSSGLPQTTIDLAVELLARAPQKGILH